MGTPEVVREFVGLDSLTVGRAGAGGHPCQGLYHHAAGQRPKVAMIATHYQIDFSEHYIADYMAARGIGFLGWNTRFRGFESNFLLDHALVDIGVGVRWLREVVGVETVVLLGNSGGGSLMAAYQSQAVDPNVAPLEGMRPAAGLDDLPVADGYVASAAHPGRPEVLTAWMDGAVVDESDPVATDPDLDLFDERNVAALRPRVRGPVSRRTGSAQSRHHRVGRRRTGPGPQRGFLRPAVHRHAHLGRPAHGRPDDRADQSPTQHVLRGGAGKGQPLRPRHRGVLHAAQLAGDVESSARTDPCRTAPGADRLPRAGDQRRGRHRRVPLGRPAHPQRARRRSTRPWCRSIPTTTSQLREHDPSRRIRSPRG